eukprot:m51a1_g13509 hypothetical protein (186) ;mRNA; r:1189-2166
MGGCFLGGRALVVRPANSGDPRTNRALQAIPTVIVMHVPPDVGDESKIAALFEGLEVTEVRAPKYEGGQFRPFCFVDFKTREMKEQALRLYSKCTLNGTCVLVKDYVLPEERQQQRPEPPGPVADAHRVTRRGSDDTRRSPRASAVPARAAVRTATRGPLRAGRGGVQSRVLFKRGLERTGDAGH